MTRFTSPSFSVAASSGNDAERRSFCAEKGHSARDSKGRCLCCGEKFDMRAALIGFTLGLAKGFNVPMTRADAERIVDEMLKDE